MSETKRPAGLSDSVFIHPLALVESSNIGAQTRIWAFSHVMKDSQIGEGCNVGEHVYVETGARIGNRVTVKNGISIWNGVEIEDEVFLGPHMIFTNVLRPRAFIKTPPEDFSKTRVCRGATIGAGAVIVCGITLGEYCFIAAGTVVTKDVPAHGFVVGNPGRLTGFVCRCTKLKAADLNGALRCEICKLDKMI